MIGQSVAKKFGKSGKQIVPVSRKVPEGYVTIETDESTGTKIIAPKAKVK